MTFARSIFVHQDNTRGTLAIEAREALGGLVTSDATGAPLPGVLRGCLVSGTATWAYQISAGQVVLSHGGQDGAAIAANAGIHETEPAAPAPTSGARYDLIWVRQHDPEGSDSDAGIEVGVTSGTPSATPSRPTAEVPAGALVLAEALVPSTAVDTLDAAITQLAPPVAARGGISIGSGYAVTPPALRAAASAENPLLMFRNGILYVATGSGDWTVLASSITETADAAAFTAATGWALQPESCQVHVVGRTARIYIAAERTGAALPMNVNNTGDIANTAVCTVSSRYAAVANSALTSGAGGRMFAGYINSSGAIAVTAAGGSVAVAVGEVITLSGMYLLKSWPT